MEPPWPVHIYNSLERPPDTLRRWDLDHPCYASASLWSTPSTDTTVWSTQHVQPGIPPPQQCGMPPTVQPPHQYPYEMSPSAPPAHYSGQEVPKDQQKLWNAKRWP